MAAPNIISVSTIKLKSNAGALSTTTSDLLENPASSGKVIRIAAMYITNIDGATTANATIGFYNGTNTYKLGHLVSVPAQATLVFTTKESPVNLEETHKITGSASANSKLDYVISYEEIS